MKQAGFFIFLSTVVSFFTVAQDLATRQVKQTGDYYFNYETYVASPGLYTVSPGQEFTGFSVKIPIAQSFSGVYMAAGSDTIAVVEDPHVFPDDRFRYSNLIVFDEPAREFKFYSGSLTGKIHFVLINNTNLETDRVRQRKQQAADPCAPPVSIDQSEWRAGLPEPDYNRIFTDVSNLIVHHSATSNNLTNYTNVVRNIYLFHTQERGWSDIGYNYLVAPDGTLYKGRDPAEGEQDNVLGAHFCGANSGTMGACVLGTYTDVEPAEAALETLINLLTWKSGKSELNPTGSAFHPLDDQLPVIAGHRDGCSTLCPGDLLYARLGEIRMQSEEELNACPEGPHVSKTFPNPATDVIKLAIEPEELAIRKIYFADMMGRVIEHHSWQKEEDVYLISNYQLSAGVYILHVELENGDALNKKVVVLNH